MRTTLNIQSYAFEAAAAYAAARAMKLGDAVSELLARGLEQVSKPAVATKKVNDIWVFDPSAQSSQKSGRAKISAAQVKDMIDD